MGDFLKSFALCLAFFTRIPLPDLLATKISADAKLSDAVIAIPVTGVVIGLFPAVIWYLSGQILNAAIAAGLAILAGVVITGALHEDGLADCADGLGATQDKQKALEIMRDSRIGTYGAIAIVVTITLRWMALATLSPVAGALALIIAHCGSRTTMITAMRYSQYARKEGLGEQASGELPAGSFETAVIIALIFAILLGWIAGVIALITGFGCAWLFLKYLENRIGGYTGDGFGAMQQIAEISILICLSGFWA